jgi:hypothetical protein
MLLLCPRHFGLLCLTINFIVAQMLCNIVVGFDSSTMFKGRSSLLAISMCCNGRIWKKGRFLHVMIFYQY